MYYRNYINNSLTYKVCSGIKHKLSVFYQDSRIYEGFTWSYKTLLACWRGSFLNRMSEGRIINNPQAINNSNVVKRSILYYNKSVMPIAQCLRLSKIYIFSKSLNEDFNRATVKSLSIVFIIAVPVDTVLSIALGREIGFWGWFVRGLFIFIGWAGLFCPVSWQEIQKTSCAIKNMLLYSNNIKNEKR